MITLEQRLLLDNRLYEEAILYQDIHETTEGLEADRAFTNWRLNIYQTYLSILDTDSLSYSLKKLREVDVRVFLEFKFLIDDMLRERYYKAPNESFSSKILSYVRKPFKKEESNETIRTDSQIWDRRSSNASK